MASALTARKGAFRISFPVPVAAPIRAATGVPSGSGAFAYIAPNYTVTALDQRQCLQFVLPAVDHGCLINLLEVEFDPCLQFVGRGDSDTAQQGFRHFAEERFDRVQPGSVFRR